MRKYLLPFIFLLNLFAITAARAQDATTFVVGELNYTVTSETDKEVSVKAADKNSLTGNVVIPPSVTNDNIEYTVTAIKGSGFSQCSGLTGITLPATVVKIGDWAFDFSSSLENIEVDKDNYVFSSEDGVLFNKDKSEIILYPMGKTGEYSVPASVKAIGMSAFYRSKLQQVTLQQGITEIKGSAFSQSHIQEMRLPNDLKFINPYAFQSCKELQEIDIPASVTIIGQGAFDACTKLQSINVEEGNENYISQDGVLYNKAKSELIQYPGGKAGTFTVPSTVTGIGGQAFSWANQLTELYLPANLSTIGGSAFYQCTGLTKIVDLRSEPQPLTQYDFYKVPESVEIIVPKGSLGLYKQAPVWSQFSNYSELPGEGESFMSGNFKYTILSDTGYDVSVEAADKNALTGNVVIPPSVTNDNIEYTVTAIEGSGFSQCSGLTGITLPATLVKIGDNAFDLSMSLENIEVDKENNVFSSEDGVLFNKDKSELILCPIGKTGEYIIPASVKTIGWKAFFRSKLQQITLQQGIIEIGWTAFCASNIQVMILPNDLKTIGLYAFQNCNELQEIYIPASVTAIGYGVFDACTKLQSINVEEGNENYISEDGVLYNKAKSELIQYPAGKAGIFTVPSTVTEIGGQAFSWANQLTEIWLPTNLSTIGSSAFYQCTGLTKIVDLHVEPQALTQNVFSNVPESVVIFVPKGSLEIYREAPVWSQFSNYSELPGEGESFVSGNFKYTILSDTGYDVSVEAADKNAFTGNVVIPASVVNNNIEYTVTAIKDLGFSYCFGLTGITLPATVVKIGDLAFDLSSSLENIEVNKENNVFSSEDGVLFNKDKSELTLCPMGKTGEYSVPASVKTIGLNAFFRSELKQITLQPGITEIKGSAFSQSHIQEMRLPNDLKFINPYAFSGCNELQEIDIPASVTIIGQGAFDACRTLQSINVEEGNGNYISEDGILYNIDKSKLIQYPAGKPGTFTVPSTVTEIGSQAFSYANRLTEIWLLGNLSTIGYQAFYQCTGLKRIIDLSLVPQDLTANVFEGVPEAVKVYVPKGRVDLYRTAEGWNKLTDYYEMPAEGDSFIADGLEYTILSADEFTLKVQAASNNNLKDNIEIPARIEYYTGLPYSVVDLSLQDFNNSNEMISLYLPETIKKINYSMSSDNLVSINIDENNPVYSSYDGVLFDKDKKTLLYCPQGKTEEFTVPSETEIIAANAFRDSKLRKVNLGENVTSIDSYAFLYSAIEEVVFPETLTTIEYGAFLGTQLVEVNLPESLIYMDPIAFNECEKLQNINVAEGNEQYSSIDGVMFNKAETKLIQYPGGRKGEYTIPSSVIAIGEDAFSHSKGMTSVTIPASVETIEDYAFYRCLGLERINDLSLTPQKVGYATFKEVPENVVVRVFKGSKENYETAKRWSNFQHYEELPNAGYSFIAGEFKYTIASDSSLEVSIEATDKETLEGDLTIPAITTYDGLNYTVVAVENEGFYGCPGVVSYSLPSTIASIGPRAFNSKGVEAIEVSEDNPYFSSEDGVLFDKKQTMLIYCPSAKDGQYEIPVTTKTINENAFENSLLTDVYIPENINVISSSLFNSADKLQAISVAEENAALSGFGGVLFNKERTELLKYPNGKEGEYLIPEGVKEIGENAFNGSGLLTELLIPSSVENIGVNAFDNCSLLSKLTSMSLLPPAAIEASFANIPKPTILYVPVKSMEAYSESEGWSLFTDVRGIYGIGDTMIRDGILFTVISDSEVSVEMADEELSERDLILPANVRMGENDYSVTIVKEGGFHNLQGITRINIPSTIRLIGAGAFAGCTNVETIDVDDENEFYSSVDGILYNKDNSELIQAPGMSKEIEIAERVEVLGEFAFAGCKDLTKIVCLNLEPLIATQVTFRDVPADAVIYVPAGSGDAYRQAEGWKMFADIREIGDLKIELNATTLVMSANSTSQLTAEVTNETIYSIVSEEWESSNPTIAGVSEFGEVTAIANGKAVISYTVTLSNGEKVTVSCNVTVDSSSDVKVIFGEIDYTAPYMVFDLKGVFVGDSTENLPSGIYIIRQGKIVKKVRL